MAIDKTIDIAGIPTSFRASAALPRLYRFMFRRDIMTDMRKLLNSYQRRVENGEQLSYEDYGLFEDVAYSMAKHADPSIPDTSEEWLEQYDIFSIYEVLPEIIELWALNNETLIEVKKNWMRIRQGGK